MLILGGEQGLANFDDAAFGGSGQTKLTIRMGTSVSSRIDAHLDLLKEMRKRTTKSEWIAEAIREKFQGDEAKLAKQLSDKRLCVSIHDDLIKLMDSVMNTLRQAGVAQTKNRLILEALMEKLDRESREVWDWLDEFQSHEQRKFLRRLENDQLS